MTATITGPPSSAIALSSGDNTTPIIKGKYVDPVAGTFDTFSLSPAGQLRVAAESGDAATLPQGLKLVRNFGGGATDFDIDTDTNSVNIKLSNVGTRAVSGKHELLVPGFTSTGTEAFVACADALISDDVTNGFVIDRGLNVTTLKATNQITLQDDTFAPGLTTSIMVGSNAAESIACPGISASTMVVAGNEAAPPSAGGAASINLTAQSASISSTKLTNAARTGYYLVHYTLEDTTTQVGVATAQFAIAYTDDAGATTQTGAALTLTAIGRDRDTFHAYLASGDITYTVTVVGVVGTGRFALRTRVEFLG